MIHDLKAWPDDFQAVLDGGKTHEARKADRVFSVGDALHLREWKPDLVATDGHQMLACGVKPTGNYTGRAVTVIVTHVTHGVYGLPRDLAIMSIRMRSGPTATCLGLDPSQRPPVTY